MKKVIGVFLAGCFCWLANTGEVAAQDIHFSQFYENAILRNPALTGIFSGDYKVGVNFRNQWSNIGVPFVTVLASAETRVALNKETGDFLSFGLTATYDKAGSISFNSMQVYPAVNLNKSLGGKHYPYLSVGFAGGYIQRSVDVSKMTFSNQYVNGNFSATNATGETMMFNKIQHYDLSAGISLNSSAGENNRINYYIGAAAYHLAKPKQAFGDDPFVRLSTRWSGNMGFNAAVDEHIGVTVHLNYQNQSPYQEIMAGGLVSWKNYNETTDQRFGISAGCFVRVKDAIIPTIKIDYNYYSFTASYDINTSSLRPTSNGVGGYEFSLFARGNYKRNLTAADRIRCPRFEYMIPSY